MAAAQTVWKEPLTSGYFNRLGQKKLSVPNDAEFLHVALQHGQIVVWFRCDPYAPKKERLLAIHGTGDVLPPSYYEKYIGTVFEGEFVWHVFEVINLETLTDGEAG